MKCPRLSRIIINSVLLGSVLFPLVLLGGCAPRYLEKTPSAILRYPYIPVDPKELEAYQSQLAVDPYHLQAAKARFWVAQYSFNRAQWDSAEKQFLKIIKKHSNSEWAPVAGIMAARCQVKLNKSLAALAGLQRVQDRYGSQIVSRQAVEALAKKIINDELTLAELARVRAIYPETAWSKQALFVTGKRNLDMGNPDLAIKFFGQFLLQYPRSMFAPMAKELMEKAVRIVPVSRRRIGCLLPLTGPYAPYGNAIHQGLELALETINRYCDENEQLSLAVVDTLGTMTGALAGFRRLAEKEKVMVVVGPALSNSVKVLLPELNKHKVCLITTSAAEAGLPEASPYLFRYMLTNQEQGKAMAEYVVLRKNYRRIGIINGEAPYDRSLAEAFEEKAQQLGGEITAHLEYPRGATDFKTQMMALGGIDPGILKDLKVRQRKVMERLVEIIAYESHSILVLRPEKEATPGPAPTLVPDKRVAIIRFTETGSQTQKEKLGKLFTEKISYALAPRGGVKVLTQAKTFQAIRELGLSTLAMSQSDRQKLADALDVQYLLVGQIRQLGEEQVNLPGEPLPIRYEIKVDLMNALTGKVLKKFKKEWVKSIPPEQNVKDMEAIYLPVPARDAILIASQLAFYDLKVAIFGCDAWLTPKFIRQAGPELKQAVLATGFWPEDPSVRCKEFITQFERKFKTHPSLLAVQAYDALYLIEQVLAGIQKTNIGRADFQKQLLRTNGFRGVTGKTVVGPNGEIKREAVFLKMYNKKLQRVQ
ncbi:penicillin-binding protein activator [bacterium]|nr:penicillin-binding protein activator [bacterium]